MTELSRFTKQMQEMIPQWMKMARDPDSVGAQFLNVFGMEFEDVQGYLDKTISNQFIDSADISQIDVSYKIPIGSSLTIIDMEGLTSVVGITLYDEACEFLVVESLRDFYQADEDTNVAILDRGQSILYLRPKESIINQNVVKPLKFVDINGVRHFEVVLHHIWNPFDEFALLLGVQRLYGERNSQIKERILDVFRKPGNSTKQGLEYALTRELGLAEDEVKVNALSDPAYKNTLLDENGNPTHKLMEYADQINRTLGFSWDRMTWGEAYWKSIEDLDLGLEYLPHIWDATVDGWKDEDFQSGIGDQDDLKVRAPEKLENTRTFNYYVGLRGVQKGSELVNPEISFKYKITAKGTIMDETYRQEAYRYTIVASEILRLHYIVRAYKKYSYTTKIEFDNTLGFRWDDGSNPSLEVVTGETIMSPPTDPILHVQVELNSNDKASTPRLNSLSVTWEDTSGTPHDITFDSQADFDGSSVIVDTDKQDTLSTEDGAIELGFGDFYHVIDTREDWKKGQYFNIDVENDGTIRLKHSQEGS